MEALSPDGQLLGTGSVYGIVIDCELTVWNATIRHQAGLGTSIESMEPNSQRHGMDNFYVTSPLSDNTDGFISAQIWANLFTTGLNSTSEEFINELNLELPKRALSYGSAFMFPAAPDSLSVQDQTTNLYPLAIIVVQLTLYVVIAVSSLAIAVLGLLIRSPEVELGPVSQDVNDSDPAQPQVTIVELSRAHLTDPLIPAINGASAIRDLKLEGATSVQRFLDPLKHYSVEETLSSVHVAPSLRARDHSNAL